MRRLAPLVVFTAALGGHGIETRSEATWRDGEVWALKPAPGGAYAAKGR